MTAPKEPAPPLIVDRWVQGDPGPMERHRGKVILIEVFQINCPGCFLGGLPEAIDIYLRHREDPLEVWGLATAFEDYRINNLENLHRLLETGEVVGETYRRLAEANLLTEGRLQYFIPFPVAWDRITPRQGEVSPEEVEALIRRDFPRYEEMPAAGREWVRRQVSDYLKQKTHDAATFDRYQLRGTPSAILIDKQGFLRHKLFGSGQGLETLVNELLNEKDDSC